MGDADDIRRFKNLSRAGLLVLIISHPNAGEERMLMKTKNKTCFKERTSLRKTNMGDIRFTYNGLFIVVVVSMKRVKAPALICLKTFSPVMYIKYFSDQGNTGLLLNLDLFEKGTTCGKKSTKNPAE